MKKLVFVLLFLGIAWGVFSSRAGHDAGGDLRTVASTPVTVEKLDPHPAEQVIAEYIRAAGLSDNINVLLPFIATSSFRHKDLESSNQNSHPPAAEAKRSPKEFSLPVTGTNLPGHSLLTNENPEYIRLLRLQIYRMETTCKKTCSVHVFLRGSKSQDEVVQNYIVGEDEDGNWKIINVEPIVTE